MAEKLYFTKEHERVRLAVRDFVKKEINLHCDEWEAAGFSPLHDLFKKMGDLGFLGIRPGVSFLFCKEKLAIY
ncbi:MAG: acyl-CoA dehydrogenase family protein, partial [Deltaproteobacteria bacterium]|nr:acyl-CoA dehydrogenase family protein [Deltaproteobacteria bacterium]